MRLIQTISFIIHILFFLQSYFCQSEIWNYDIHNNISSSDTTFTIDPILKKNLLKNNSLTNIKYTTDEDDYTSVESIAFSIRLNQPISQVITILAGLTYDNINYVFNIENNRPTFIITQENQLDLILTIKNNSQFLDNHQWYRLKIERLDRKLKFHLNYIEQSTIELTDEWQEKTNIFIGAELTPIPNDDYFGEISDIIVSNFDQSVKLHEDDNFDEDFSYINQTESTQTIAFLPHENNPIIFPSPIKSFFKTFSFSFRAYSNMSILIQFEDINLNIDIDGYLTLGVRNRQTQKIFSKRINDGNSYFVQIELKKKLLEVWIDDETKKTSIELLSSFLIIENFLFGLNNQFIGCIENVTYNKQLFLFENLSFNRRQCPIKIIDEIFINQIISFKQNDQPLIIQIIKPEEFQIFSFLFTTQESNCIICSLVDQTYENILILSIYNEQLLLTYYNKQHEKIEISTNYSINDRKQHKIIIRNDLSFQLDENIIRKNITNVFSIQKISIGKLDEFIYFDLNNENFLGCIENLILNHKSLIKFEHINQLDRLTDSCQLPNLESKNLISYISSNISFSIRNPDDIIEIELPLKEKFNHLQLSIKTRSFNGIILSLYSTNNSLILFLNDGKLQLIYYSSNNQSLNFNFNENQLINNGKEYSIIFSRQYSKTILSKYDIQISIPLFISSFDILILGESLHIPSKNQFIGCFSNIIYNHNLLLPEGIMKSDRYDCYYEQDSICNRQTPCPIDQSLQFCGQNDCSLVCIPPKIERYNRGLIEYLSDIQSGENEQIYLTIFTTSSNSTLFMTTNGSIQVSIVLENSYPRLIIQKGGIIYTYDFPGRIRGDQWHTLQCQKTLTTLDLTFDDETRHYTNLTEYFSLFGNRKIHICGENFIGYVQDIILMVDNQYENLIQNSLDNPGLIEYDRSVTWNNRADIPERLDIDDKKPFRCIRSFRSIYLHR